MIWVLFLPLALFIAIVLLAHLHILGLTLDKTIKLSDISPLAATTLVAVVIQYFFEKRGKATGIEKDLLSSHVDGLIESLMELREKVVVCLGRPLDPSETAILIDSFETWGESLSNLREILRSSHCEALAPTCSSIIEAFIDYKSIITGGNFPRDPISWQDFSRSAHSRHKIERELRLLTLYVAKG